MNFCEVIARFLPLASETIERIQHDQNRAPRRTKIFLAYLERRLFAPGLTTKMALEACQIRDRSFSTQFRQSFGLGPKRYIESCRMEVAEKLIRLTSVKIEWISPLLGYASVKVFSNAFLRQTGHRPQSYRKRCKSTATQLIESQESSELDLILQLKKAVTGRLQLADVDRLLRRLHHLYPELESRSSQLHPAIRNFHL